MHVVAHEWTDLMKSLQGTVVEREEIELTEAEVKDGFYPMRCLVSGVSWPEDVDPAKREQYLNPVEFEQVFGMTKVGKQ